MTFGLVEPTKNGDYELGWRALQFPNVCQMWIDMSEEKNININILEDNFNNEILFSQNNQHFKHGKAYGQYAIHK